MVDGVARARIRVTAALLREQSADAEPARLREVVVQVVDLHVEDELVAGDGSSRRVEVTGGVWVQEIAAADRAGACSARGRVEREQHERGAADRTEERAPAHTQPPGLRVGGVTSAADRLGLDLAHRRWDVLAVRARTELDG